MNLAALPLDLLRTFTVFIESPNIVAAAEKLRVSQPLVTKHLQLLEEACPLPVFQFEGRKKTPTVYGRSLYGVIKAHLDHLEADLNNLEMLQASSDCVRVRIGARKELLEGFASQLSFKGHLDFQSLSGREVLQALEKKQIEIGISQYSLDSLQFIQKPFFKSSFQLVFPSSWNLKEKKPADLLAQLVDKPYLSYGSSDVLESVLGHYAIMKTPFITRSFSSWPHLLQMCQKKVGWCLAPREQVPSAAALERVDVSEKAVPSTEFFLYYSREFSKLDWFKDLIRQIQETSRT